MPKKVTLKDIAAKAGLSPASVSMILNRRSIDRFNAETVEQVYAIATELGYKSSKEKAYALVRPSDTLIIIICPSLFNPFYTTIIQGIEIAARKQGFVTSVRTTYLDTDTIEPLLPCMSGNTMNMCCRFFIILLLFPLR